MTRRLGWGGTTRLRRYALLGLAALAVLAGAGTAYAAGSAPGPRYRLATVTPAQVDAALNVVGTLSPAQQADVPFPVSGTVATVAVRSGQRVTAGQRLGSLSKASLRAALAAAQSTVDQANLQVSHDIAGQDQAASGSASGSGSGSASGSGSGSAGGAASAALRPRQQAVLRAQRRADHALARARAALAQAGQVCTSPAPSPSGTPPASRTPVPGAPSPSGTPPASRTPVPGAPSPSGTPPASRTPVPGATPSAGATPSRPGTPSPSQSGRPSPAPTPASAPGNCARATRQVLTAETVVLHAQQALSRQLFALGAALTRALRGTGASGSGPGAGAGSGSGSSGPASAAQLAADQATADADAAQLTVAQQNLDNAIVRSPISGTVVSVAVSPGTAVTAGSTAFEIAGLDSYQVQTEVPVADLPALKVGQRASVRPDGLDRPLTGSVISIGLTPDTSNSPVTYPVTIGLAGQPGGLHPNGFASVVVSTGRSLGVSVPTSAVHYTKHGATVTVYAAGRTRTVKVTVGTKGLVRTRITAGLRASQQVVLAVLGQPLPTNNVDQGPGFGPGGGAVVLGP